jgi:hypothetical protein
MVQETNDYFEAERQGTTAGMAGAHLGAADGGD